MLLKLQVEVLELLDELVLRLGWLGFDHTPIMAPTFTVLILLELISCNQACFLNTVLYLVVDIPSNLIEVCTQVIEHCVPLDLLAGSPLALGLLPRRLVAALGPIRVGLLLGGHSRGLSLKTQVLRF